jgi:hypothetical protein
MPTYIRWRISASTSSARPGLVAEGIADTNPSASARERIQLVYRIAAYGLRRHFRCSAVGKRWSTLPSPRPAAGLRPLPYAPCPIWDYAQVSSSFVPIIFRSLVSLPATY